MLSFRLCSLLSRFTEHADLAYQIALSLSINRSSLAVQSILLAFFQLRSIDFNLLQGLTFELLNILQVVIELTRL